jgi:tRNA A-37 threonylcarbamoyl transferase component Bud32
MSNFERDVRDVRWQLGAELRHRFANGAAFNEQLCSGAVEVVKNGPHRTVYRVSGPDFDVHLKEDRPLGLRGRLRSWLRPRKARREYDLARECHARGVATPSPLAWGVSASTGTSWLVTETVPAAQPLIAVLEHQMSGAVEARQLLADVLGAFVARLHAAGVFHHDLHPGNILVRWPSDGPPQLALIDLHAVRLRNIARPLSWADCEQNLVILNRYFILRASRSDRLRFWRAYSAALGGDVPGPTGQTARGIEERTWVSNRTFWRERDRRCRSSNRYYVSIRHGPHRGYAVRGLMKSGLSDLLSEADAIFDRPDVRVLKRSPSSTVAEIEWSDGGRVIVKRFKVRRRSDTWLGLLRPSAALRSWVYGHGLRERGLPTARPLVMFHRYSGRRPREGYLLTDKIDGAIELHEWARRALAGPAERRTALLRLRVEALARLVRELHHRGLSHRDLKAPNLLTPLDPEDHRFWLIDLVGVRRRHRVSPRRRALDLSRLHASFREHPLVTRTEKLRFLRTYFNWGLRGKTGWKVWWRLIAEATRAKVARNLRRGRPLA